MSSVCNEEEFFLDNRNSLKPSLLFQIMACSISGILSALCVTPLDLVKTRLQSQESSFSPTDGGVRYTGTFDAIRKICHNEGVLGLWRGLGFSALITIPSTTIYFVVYGDIKTAIEPYFGDEGGPVIVPMVSGSLARVAATLCTSPIDLLRTNLQSHARKVSIANLIRNVARSGRWSSFLVGLKPTLCRDVPFSAIYWSSYESLKKNCSSESVIYFFFAGAISGALASLMTLPFDVVKTRFQMDFDRTIAEKVQSATSCGILETMRMIVKSEGVGSLFRGAVPRVIRVAPACAITISTYEWCKSFYF